MEIIGLFTDIIYALVFLKVVVLLGLSMGHVVKRRKNLGVRKYSPLVSIIIPCYNEELTLENCVYGVLKNSYKNIEILVINDGSTDKTAVIGQDFASKDSRIKFFSKKNAGKASALNLGIEKSRGEIIISLDADSILKKDAISFLLPWFNNPKTGAVAGNVKVANKDKFFGLQQASEYISGLNLQRRSLDALNSLNVIPGALGAFRKSVIQKAGGYSYDTKVEDMDLTIAIQKCGYKVVYEPNSVVYTETPEKMKDFITQRKRWIYGSFRVVWKYRDLIFSKRGGRIGNIGLVYSLAFPLVDVLMTILFVSTVFASIFTADIISLLKLVTIAMFYNFLLTAYSLLIDRDDLKLAFISLFLGIWYYHLISFITFLSL